MIISNNQYNLESDIKVRLYETTKSTSPFIVHIADGTTIHMSLADVQRLHLELTAAMYEYDNHYPYKETS